MDRLETQADVNKQNAATASWTLDKLLGRGKYTTESKQQALPAGLLNQLTQAATATWRAIPPLNSVGSSLYKTTQGANEPCAQFVARLLEVAERLLGKKGTDDVILKQLAFENANPTCKAALRGKMRSTDLPGMIRLCQDVDPLDHKLTKSINMAIGAILQPMMNKPSLSKSCFKCEKIGHFARSCTEGTNAMDPPQSSGAPRPAVPGLCPHCRRGRH